MPERPPARLRLATQPADMPDDQATYSPEAAAWQRIADKWIVEARAIAMFNGTEESPITNAVILCLLDLREELEPHRVAADPDDARE